MWGLGVLSVIAITAVVGYHMVRPNHRDVRLSMTHLMPVPPVSQAPKRVFSIRALVASKRFWLRIVCVGLVASTLYPLAVQVPEQSSDGARHFRLIVDVSASMAVEDPAGGSRMDRAHDLADQAFRAILLQKAEDPRACIDLALVGATIEIVPLSRVEATLAGAEPRDLGSPMATLLAALSTRGPADCDSVPTHVVVVTDQPEQAVSDEVFAGHLIWQQVGAPMDNLAIWHLSVGAGTLGGAVPKIDLRVASFGTAQSRVTATIDGPNGQTGVTFRRDETREGGWRTELPFDGAGTYRVALAQGGALSVDDRITFELGALDRVAVDWQLDGVRRPQVLRRGEGGETVVSVARYSGEEMQLPPGPFVLVYDGWRGVGAGQIGPFIRDHPILDGINFDVLERRAPQPASVAGQEDLVSVIRPEASRGIWIAVREKPRGALVPMPISGADTDVTGLSKLMFYNALSWVAQGDSVAEPRLDYVTEEGRPVTDARAESNTARVLSSPANLALLSESALEPITGNDGREARMQAWPLTPWVFVLVLSLMLVERLIGLLWSKREGV